MQIGSRIFLGVALLILLPTVIGDAYAQSIRIQLNDLSMLDKQEVLLGDIADVQSPRQIQNQIRGIHIGTAPRAGHQAIYKKTTINEFIGRKIGPVFGAYVLDGPENIKIVRSSNRVNMKPVLVQCSQVLEKSLSEKFPEILRWKLSPNGAPAKVTVPDGIQKIRCLEPKNLGIKSRVSIWINISVDGEAYQTVPLWFSLKAYTQAYVTTGRIYPREKLKADLFRLDEIDVARVGQEPLRSFEDIRNMWVARVLPKGHVVLASDVVSIPSVQAAQPVIVVASTGSVKIETRGIAEKDGQIGDRIPVRILNSTNSITGYVSGASMVSVR